MARTALTQLLLFLAPFAVYAIVLYATRRDAREKEHWPAKTLIVLAVAGSVLFVGGLLYLAHFGGAPTSGVYEPARIENGKLIPGRIK